MHLSAYLEEQRLRVNRALDSLLPAAEGPERTVAEAMRYSVLGPGKRLRPIIALAACRACGADTEPMLEAAAALELIHTYSLIHDDLPAMDDDDLRRGRPTAHREFGEAVAILAGDALQALAFEVLGRHPSGDEMRAERLEAVGVVAAAAGIAGMVGGQGADLEAEGKPPEVDLLSWIHRHKTGALFRASAEIGAIHARANPEHRAALARYGEAIGLAFQIADDLLDDSASAEDLGKTPGKDRRAGKATFPALLGAEASREKAREQVRRATAAVEPLGEAARPLVQLAEFAVARTR